MKLFTVGAMWGFVFLLLQPANAFILRNFTGETVTAKVNGNTYTIDPHNSYTCDYHDDSCTGIADDAAARTSSLTVQMEAETFVCVLPLVGGGTAVFREKNRAPLNVPFEFYCDSLGINNEFITEAPYGVNATSRDVRFLVTGDPQIDASDENTPCTQDPSAGCGDPGDRADADATLGTMVRMIRNTDQIRGAIIAGDLVHNNQKREFDHYKDQIAGMSRFFFDGIGNHDIRAIDSYSFSICDFLGGKCQNPEYIVGDIADRKRATRQTNHGGKFVFHDPSPVYLPERAVENPHYSWDWHDVHFVQLNLFPGDDPGLYEGHDPGKSLTFLQQDLQSAVGTSGRPVVLIHHYGFDKFSTGIDGKKDANGYLIVDNNGNPVEAWWTEAQRTAYWNAIKDYNVVAIFTGHLHDTTGDEKGWQVDFPQPPNALNRPDGRTSLRSFISGAARGSTGNDYPYPHGTGVFLDVTLDACNTMTITRKDPHGTALTGQQVLVQFTTPNEATTLPTTCGPTVKCQDVTISLPGGCSASVDANSINNGSVDPFGGTLACKASPAGPYNAGTTNVTLSCTSSVNNRSASCPAKVTLVPNTYLSCPGPQVVECTGNVKAQVNLAATVANACGDVFSVSCPASGSDFPLGFSPYFCFASDSKGVDLSCNSTVTVRDTIPPQVSCPIDLTVDASSTIGAIVTFAATASDQCDARPMVKCPASGSTFGIGTTTAVSCSATDQAGLTATCNSTVHVRSLAETGNMLKTQVTALRTAGRLNHGQANALQTHLDAILAAIAEGRSNAACVRLQNVVNQVTNFVSGGTLTATEGQSLITPATNLRGALGCAA